MVQHGDGAQEVRKQNEDGNAAPHDAQRPTPAHRGLGITRAQCD